MAGSLLQGNDDGMNELDFQTVLHILVHAHIGDAVAVIQGADAELVYVVSTEQIPIFAAAIKSAKSAQTGAKGYAGFYADSTLQSTWQA